MSTPNLTAAILAALLASIPAAALPGGNPANAAATAAPSADDQKIIASAEQAAPRKVAERATIVAARADGTMRTVRAGDNGFTCMADNPATPGPDPMCMDAHAMEWAAAWIGHRDPPPGKVGFMYMLGGGTDASNTDPFATRPTASNQWIETGPHVLIVSADASFYQQYPKGDAPDTQAPYVMWAGTPYEHLMIPVK